MSTQPLFPDPRAEIDAAIRGLVGDYEHANGQWNTRTIVTELAQGTFAPATESLIRDQGLMRLVQDITKAATAKAGGKMRAVRSATGVHTVEFRQLSIDALAQWIQAAETDHRGRGFEIDYARAVYDEAFAHDLAFVSEISNDRLAEIRAEIAERYAA